MALQNFVANTTPTVKAVWLNAIDAFYTTLFNSATSAVNARAAISAASSGVNTDITSLASPEIAGATATTQTAGDSTTKVATTAFVTALKAAVGVFTKNQSVTPVAIAAGATKTINASLSNNFTIAVDQNFTLAAATNATDGMIINIVFTQGATPYVITWNAVWQFPGGVEAVLTATANAIDFMSAYYNGATAKWICVMNKDFKA